MESTVAEGHEEGDDRGKSVGGQGHVVLAPDPLDDEYGDITPYIDRLNVVRRLVAGLPAFVRSWWVDHTYDIYPEAFEDLLEALVDDEINSLRNEAEIAEEAKSEQQKEIEEEYAAWNDYQCGDGGV